MAGKRQWPFGPGTPVPPPPGDIEIMEERTPAEVILGERLSAWLMTPERGNPPQLSGRTLTLWYREGQWHASLHRRARRAVAFLTACTLDALLQLLAKGVQEDGLIWRQDRP